MRTDCGIAANRVDVIGHSMGGLLARLGAADPTSRGQIYRLITFDTPHRGSELADLYVTASGLIRILNPLFSVLFRNFSPSAMPDLAIGRISIPSSDLPTHLIAGAAGPAFYAENSPSLVKALFFVTGKDDLGEVIFGGQQNDAVVSLDSQLDGFTGASSFVDVVTSFPDGVHTHNTTSPEYSQLALAAMESAPSGETFVSHLPGIREYSSRSISGTAAQHVETVESGDLTVSNPAAGSRFSPGQAIAVRADTSAAEVDAVAFVIQGDIQIDSTAPFEADLTAPSDVIGSTEIRAFARLSDGSFLESPSVAVIVEPTSPIAELSILPNDHVVIAVGERMPIELLARPEGSSAWDSG